MRLIWRLKLRSCVFQSRAAVTSLSMRSNVFRSFGSESSALSKASIASPMAPISSARIMPAAT